MKALMPSNARVGACGWRLRTRVCACAYRGKRRLFCLGGMWEKVGKGGVTFLGEGFNVRVRVRVIFPMRSRKNVRVCVRKSG